MSAPAILLHGWRLRSIRRAMALLGCRLDAYERAYGRPPFNPADPLHPAGSR